MGNLSLDKGGTAGRRRPRVGDLKQKKGIGGGGKKGVRKEKKKALLKPLVPKSAVETWELIHIDCPRRRVTGSSSSVKRNSASQRMSGRKASIAGGHRSSLCTHNNNVARHTLSNPTQIFISQTLKLMWSFGKVLEYGRRPHSV